MSLSNLEASPFFMASFCKEKMVDPGCLVFFPGDSKLYTQLYRYCIGLTGACNKSMT